MSTPQPGGIAYDAEAVMRQAYARIADLTMSLDQLVNAYERQSLELQRLQEDVAAAKLRSVESKPLAS